MDGALQQFLTVLTLSFVLLLQALLYLLLQILLLLEGFLSDLLLRHWNNEVHAKLYLVT